MHKRLRTRLAWLAERNGSDFYKAFGASLGKMKILGDIESPHPQLWDCELGIAYRDENGVAFDYNDNEIDLIEAVKNAR